MLLLDVNVLVDAHRRDSAAHADVNAWLSAASMGSDRIGLCDPVLYGFLRIVTHPRVFRDPTPLTLALDYCDSLLRARATIRVRPGARLWGPFRDVLENTGCVGNDVPDAYLATLAIDTGATLVTRDRGFGRFPGLQVRSPVV